MVHFLPKASAFRSIFGLFIAFWVLALQTIGLKQLYKSSYGKIIAASVITIILETAVQCSSR